MPYKDPTDKAKNWKKYCKEHPGYQRNRNRVWMQNKRASDPRLFGSARPCNRRYIPLEFANKEEEIAYLVKEQYLDDQRTCIKFTPSLNENKFYTLLSAG